MGAITSRLGTQTPPLLSPPSGGAVTSASRRRASLSSFVLLLLLIAALHGLLYVAIVPPFAAPDEDSQFEYAYLVARLGRLPQAGDVSLALRQQMKEVMQASPSGFWRGRLAVAGGARAVNSGADVPGQIGRQPPLYYLVGAVLLVLAGVSDVETSLYLLRLLSVLFNLGVIYLAYRSALLVFPRRAELALGVSLFIALLPQYTFSMASVNNDALATLLCTAVVWASLSWLRHGGIGWAAFTLTVLCLAMLAKATALLLVLALALALPVYVVSRLGARYGWGRSLVWAGLALVVTSLALGLSGSLVYQESNQADSWIDQTRNAPQTTNDAPRWGDRALLFARQQIDQPEYLLQRLPHPLLERLRGRHVTIGGWVRALAQPTDARIDLTDGQKQQGVSATVATNWTLLTTAITVSENANWLDLTLYGASACGGGACPLAFDGLFLIEGQLPDTAITLDPDGSVIANGLRHPNLVANSSGEQGTRVLIAPLQSLLTRLQLTPDNAGRFLIASGIRGEGPTIQRIVGNGLSSFESFWAAMWLEWSWPPASLATTGRYEGYFALPVGLYALWGLGVLLSLGGALRLLLGRRTLLVQATTDRVLYLVCAIVALVFYGLTNAIYMTDVLSARAPQARYLFPAIVPISLLGIAGLSAVNNRWRLRTALLILSGVCIAFALTVLGYVLRFYYS